MKIFQWFGRTTLNTRVWLVMLTAALGLGALTTMGEIESREVQMDSLADGLHDQVQSAIAIADGYRQRALNGEMSDADARKAALHDIQTMRWDDGGGYIFAFDSKAVLLMHPLRKDIGANLHDEADPSGFHHYAAMVTTDLDQGHGMTRYVQSIPKTGESKPKISYSEWYKPWDMHFASGEYFDHINAAFHAALLKSLLRAAGVAFVVIMLIWVSMRSIKATIGGEPGHAVRIATRIAEGDLCSHADESFPEGSLLDMIERMRHRLSAIVADVQSGAAMVTLTSQQLAQGNDDLSQRTQEQASSLEETAASMEEMTATVKQNAENARAADQLTRAARAQSERGSAVAEEVMQAMSNIGESSRKIAEIISMIDEIAFQTNLLALNAAVEAARAGEHGRGFGVVAAEVRRLAQSSASASRDIKQLIGESAERVEVGEMLVAQSAESLRAITGDVKRVTDIVAEIAAASQEQSAGVDQVNIAISQIDQVTQENAALVEEAAAAAKSMMDQADLLRQQVAYFTIDSAPAAKVGTRVAAQTVASEVARRAGYEVASAAL
ncbi:methyl-accepting chemotaxis protein [Dyella sp.]|uniref:methyl-accepting chemotaxis protein n=1 Tax=Dyella sp. TaxID=1869338 RepID=UPI002ED1E482